MGKQVPVDDSALAHGIDDDGMHQITSDVAYKRLGMVNVMYFGMPRPSGDTPHPWVLIDCGLPGTAGMIARAADEHFGKHARPTAIILTHGHIDHVGGLEDLLERWNVPVYAHELERPYLDGTRSYPPPDPTVGGGLMSLTSPMFSRGPIDVSRWLNTLPADGAVPGMPGWRWIHTPGHTPGHVSLWRANDRTLIAGDAFITTKQESAYAVATQRPELHGPPMYFTPDWDSARESVRRLATLAPELAITGHGRPLHGPEMRQALNILARDFDEVAVPKHGRYVDGQSDTATA
jgi:glyoxylase-like metal-dependent hydrolase (beta-lactamase superfamily II)